MFRFGHRTSQDESMNPLFVKLMMMTTSSNDGEALTALRKANAILAEANVNWAEFLSAVGSGKTQEDNSFRVKPSERQKRRNQSFDDNSFSDVGKSAGSSSRYDDAKEIEPMFERAFANAGNSGFRDFLDSVHEWWEDKGFLSDKQYQAVKKAADR
jgi:hypothetical protein